MIGVVANPRHEVAVKEFFELFKTPWEFHQSDRQYTVLLCDRLDLRTTAQLVLVFSSLEDSTVNVATSCRGSIGGFVTYKSLRIPIYGNKITFPEQDDDVLVDEESEESMVCRYRSSDTVVVRVGYDLFHEIHTLLTAGQPAANASVPTLELHVELLRNLITAAGVRLIEIPPVPEGYKFIACLTHDVDHPAIRNHRFDRTMFGFLYRATVLSLLNAFRGRLSVRQMFTNWVAVLRLPFVHLGLAKDFWQPFDRYQQMEGGPCSTFFVIPFEGDPGRCDAGQAPRLRASAYGASDVAAQINTLRSAGCEIGLHGIDAWRDATKGHTELAEIRRIAGTREVGVRMHWLYFDEHSPATLEKAGADYDSTVGYNEAVGYRAGTTQVYKPIGTARLLELPLHIMDTALFFPGRLHLSAGDANALVDEIINNAVRLGGVVTVNWHDRSTQPERLWGDFYVQLIDKLKNRGAWFATAKQTVTWFRKRRSASFDVERQSETLVVRDNSAQHTEVPALLVRVHNNQSQFGSEGSVQHPASRELRFQGSMRVPLNTSFGLPAPRPDNLPIEALAGEG